MISPALTTWPPKRFTPRRWAFESRPLRDDEAPFLCAMSSSALRDVADHDAGQGLTVPLPLVVAGLVLELVDVDLRALAGLDDLAGHGHAGQRLRVGGDGVAVDEQQGRERDGVTGLPGQAVDGERVTDTHLVLRSTGLDDCVHHCLLDRSEADPALCPAHTPARGRVLDRSPADGTHPDGPVVTQKPDQRTRVARPGSNALRRPAAPPVAMPPGDAGAGPPAESPPRP